MSVPTPCALSTFTTPPSKDATISFTIERPSPVPPRSGFSWENGWNSCLSRNARDIPQPESRTRRLMRIICSSMSVPRKDTSTKPFVVNLSAFPMRFIKTRRRPPQSECTYQPCMRFSTSTTTSKADQRLTRSFGAESDDVEAVEGALCGSYIEPIVPCGSWGRDTLTCWPSKLLSHTSWTRRLRSKSVI